MAQILISESHEQPRQLLTRMVTRLGHKAVCVLGPGADDLLGADVFVVEPATPVGAVFAQTASIAVPSLPLVCASVAAPPEALAMLGVEFAASLLKPFTFEQFADAIAHALIVREARLRIHHAA